MWDEFHWVRIKPRSRDRWGYYDLIQPQPYLLTAYTPCQVILWIFLLHYLCTNANISRAKVLASVNSIRTNKITPQNFMTLFSLSAARGGICINPEWFICFPRRLVRVLQFLFVESHTLTLIESIQGIILKGHWAFKQASPCLHPNIEVLVHKTFTNGVSEHCIIHDSMRWENCSTLVCVCGCGVSSVWAAGINLLWQEYWEAWRLCTDNLH